MITALAILYVLVAIATCVYLIWLISDIPPDEVGTSEYALAALIIVGLGVGWPVFWAWMAVQAFSDRGEE